MHIRILRIPIIKQFKIRMLDKRSPIVGKSENNVGPWTRWGLKNVRDGEERPEKEKGESSSIRKADKTKIFLKQIISIC